MKKNVTVTFNIKNGIEKLTLKTIEEYLPNPEDVVEEIFDIYYNKN